MPEIAEFVLVLAAPLTAAAVHVNSVDHLARMQGAVGTRITGAATQIGGLHRRRVRIRIWYWESGVEFLLIYWHLPGCPANDDPKLAAGTGRVSLIVIFGGHRLRESFRVDS
jgi:hypothetical protein